MRVIRPRPGGRPHLVHALTNPHPVTTIPTAAPPAGQMAQVVAENIFAIDTKFWIRIATRNDTAATKEDKDKLQALANTVMVLVRARR